jgi:hypothetical protein
MDPNINKVFISAPIDLDWSIVTRFAQKLVDNNILAFAWDRNSIYDQSIFDECASVIFLLPGNRFSAYKDHLPWGQKRELFRARSQSKKIYVGYGQIYEADTNGEDFINGISGTSNSIFTNIGKVNAKEALRMHKSGMNLVMNSMYGSFVNDSLYGELDHNPCGSYADKVFVPNPCDEVLFTTKKPYTKTIPNPDYIPSGSPGTNGKSGVMGDDIRLLLML